MRIGVINLGAIYDAQFFWTVQLLVSRFSPQGAEISIPVFDGAPIEPERLPLAIADLLTDETDFDLLVFLNPQKINADNAQLVSNFQAPRAVLACPRLPDADLIKITSRFEYALGAPVETAVAAEIDPILTFGAYPYVSPVQRPAAGSGTDGKRRAITIFSADRDADDLNLALNLLKNEDAIVLTKGSTRAKILQKGATAPIYHYSEISLGSLIEKTGVLLDFSSKIGGELHKMLLVACADAGIPLAVSPELAPLIRPLDCYPGATITPAAIEVSKQLRDAAIGTPPPPRWLHRLTHLEQAIEAAMEEADTVQTSPPMPTARQQDEPTIWMAPINGWGFGHIKRLFNIAQEIKERPVRFSCFGGAVDGIVGLGHDAVPLAGKASGHGNRRVQLLNYRRLSRICKPEDGLVFDGGYPYDSIIAAIDNKRLRNTMWIRRALFRKDQNNVEALSREKYFKAVMLPMELFEELNEDGDAFGTPEMRVNPIVDLKEPAAKNFDLDFTLSSDKRLVVTMLGGGSTGEISGEVFAICDELSAFGDVVHVVMDWPKSSYTEVARDFPNTHVIKTMWAKFFMDKAELVISAAGYNSFNEITYSRRPALYLPQSAPWMDDQERRAMAAQDRGIATVCRAGNVIGLRSAIRRLLGSNSTEIERYATNAQALELPEPGNAMAARMICETFSQ